jgi:heme oxygenase (biliverdin-producing, ferredoxin)
MTSKLATQLREGTSKSHTMAENVNFIKSFLGGVIDKGSYTEMLSKLYFVYEAIENAMEKNKEHEYIKPIYFPELNRTESLKEDLIFHYGEDWLENITLSKATLDYVNRINTISKEKPELLVAHAYTRYLGDLSGGQILKKIAQRSMGLEGSEGLAFYEFKEVSDEAQFKLNYKAALDSLPIKENEASQIIAEANTAFTLNMNIFSELEFNLVKFLLSQLRAITSSIHKQFVQLRPN